MQDQRVSCFDVRGVLLFLHDGDSTGRMRRIQISATSIGLLGAFLFPDVDVFRHLVIANSIAGLWYMHSEYDALRAQGSMYLGVVLRPPNRTLNLVYNVLVHALFPYILLRQRATRMRTVIAHTIGIYVIGIILLDRDSVYPTRNGLTPYIHLHVAVYVLSHIVLNSMLTVCDPCNHHRSRSVVIDGACACTRPS